MKRVLSFLLVLCLALPLPALGVEETGFVDVHPGDWFAPYVEVCVEAGLMKGTGEGRFSPEATLTFAESMTLAYRLYDILQGGDGSTEATPEDWGRITLRAQDGTVIETWQGDGERGWNVEGYHIGIPFPESQRAWAQESAPGMTATLSTADMTFEGVLSWNQLFMDQPLVFSSADSKMEWFWEDMLPGPETWWRDVCYTIQKRGLTDRFNLHYFHDSTAERENFVAQLTQAIGELEAINDIPSLPDSSDERVLSLYRAGILTGFDPSGTFHGQATLSRAEAAAMAARVLEPSLRLSFSPKPLPSEGYTLTYLMDGEPNVGVTYPVCALIPWEEDEPRGLLTLDGRLLPLPEGGIPSYGIDQVGAYAKIAPYTGKDPYSTSPGFIDANGVWVVPPGIYDQVRPIEGGFLAWTGGWPEWHAYRLDLNGQVVEDLGLTDSGDVDENYETPPLRSWDGLTVHRRGVVDGAYYVSSDGTAASQKFDWAGDIGPDGRGFVGLDGKIYRIEFER